MNRRTFLSKITQATILTSTLPLFGCEKKSPFKLGVCDWNLNLSGDSKSFDVAKSFGLDGVQISAPFNKKSPIFASEQNLAEIKSAMARTGLACASTSPMLNRDPFVSTQGAVEYTINAIETASILGAKSILLPFYGKADMQGKDKRIREDLFKPLVERLKQVVSVAEKFEVAIGLENALNAEDDLRIIDAVGSPMVQVYFDTYNFQYYGFETVPEMKKLKGHICQIHLKDMGHKLDSKSGCPRDMQACFDTIQEIGYKGWLVFEFSKHDPKKDSPISELLKHNIDYVKNSSLFV